MAAEHTALADVRRHGNGTEAVGRGRAAATVDAGNQAPAAKSEEAQGTKQLEQTHLAMKQSSNSKRCSGKVRTNSGSRGGKHTPHQQLNMRGFRGFNNTKTLSSGKDQWQTWLRKIKTGLSEMNTDFL